MRKTTWIGLGVAVWAVLLHCVGGTLTPADATEALHFACEKLAASMVDGTSVPAEDVIRKACHVERIVQQMAVIVRASELPDLVHELEDWPTAPGLDAGVAGKWLDGGAR